MLSLAVTASRGDIPVTGISAFSAILNQVLQTKTISQPPSHSNKDLITKPCYTDVDLSYYWGFICVAKQASPIILWNLFKLSIRFNFT